MRIHRVHTPQPLQPGSVVPIRERAAHYLVRVLRISKGQNIVLFNGDGHDYAAEVLRPGKAEVLLQVNARLPAVTEPGFEIEVVQAVSRGERMDQTLQKCTELGVRAFQPLFSERVEVRLRPEKLEKRLRHWQAVVISACEQCGRSFVPEVRRPLHFGDWVYQDGPACRLVLVPGAGAALARLSLGGPVELVVGPEGGFSGTELELLETRKVRPVSLGPRVLRTETAAPAAVAVLQALFGDLR